MDSRIQEQGKNDESDIALDKLKDAVSKRNEIEILKSYLADQLSDIASRSLKKSVAQSRQRLVICYLIKNAIICNDDQTIFDWYYDIADCSDRLFSIEERVWINDVINRARGLDDFRCAINQSQFDQAISICDRLGLISSNMFQFQDHLNLDQAHKEITITQQGILLENPSGVKGSDDWRLLDLSENDVVDLWLGGRIKPTDQLMGEDCEKLERAKLKIGINTRVEFALENKDKKYLEMLLRPESSIKIESLDAVLREKVETFLYPNG